jgi:hypothetical protein
MDKKALIEGVFMESNGIARLMPAPVLKEYRW